MIAALLATLSSAIWGTSDFIGGLAARRLPPVAVVGWAQVAGLIAVLSAARLTGGFGGPTGWIGWSVLAGLIGATGLVVFYTALSLGTMGVVSPIAALGAVIPVIGGLLHGDSPSGLQFAGMALGLAGAVTASGPELRGSGGPAPSVAGLSVAGLSVAGPASVGPRSAGQSSGGQSAGGRSVVLAAMAGVCFGVALFGIQRGAQTSPLLTMVGMRVSGVSVFIVIALVTRSTGGVKIRNLPLLAVIGVSDVGANLLFAAASTQGMNSTVAVLGSLYPVATVLLGAMLLKERMLPVQRAGVALALAGVVLLALA